MRMIVAALCLITTYSGMAAQPRGGEEPPPAALQIQASLFEKAVACIKEHEGWHGNHLPYVGYGHKLLPGETFTPDMTEVQADSLLRADLMKLCRMCSRFGKDALLQLCLIMSVIIVWSAMERFPKVGLFRSWKLVTGISMMSISHS